MINPKDFVEGERYFLMSFYDSKLAIPRIQTYIYVGKNLHSDKAQSTGDRWFFQEPESYLKHGARQRVPKKTTDIFIADEDVLPHLYDIPGLIITLKKVQDGVLDKVGV